MNKSLLFFTLLGFAQTGLTQEKSLEKVFYYENIEALMYVEEYLHIEPELLITIAFWETKKFTSKAYKKRNNCFNVCSDNWFKTFVVPKKDATEVTKSGLCDMIRYEHTQYAIIHFAYLYRELFPYSENEEFKDRLHNLSTLYKIPTELFYHTFAKLKLNKKVNYKTV
jgi:hypothetical protein